jgi:cytochrome P450
VTTANRTAGNCPVQNFDHKAKKPAGSWWQTYDDLRAQSPWFRNEYGPGFWTMVNHEGILSILQDPATFSNSAISPVDPDPPFKLIPEMLDGNEHKQWRRQLAPLFAPGAVERMAPTVHERAVHFIDGLVDQGGCDLMVDFAQKFPTTIFLDLMGLPVDELDQFMIWEDAILHSDADSAGAALAAMIAVKDRFESSIAERRRHPREDIISKAIDYQIDGAPVSDADLLAFCLLMFMAGLDTVSATLGWCFLHLARNDADRRRIAGDPSLIPAAIEEFLRAYAIVIPARKVMSDITIQGCPMKAGDMVSIPLSAATRDDAATPSAGVVDIARQPNNHIAFGAGPHRCLGSHLARRELRVALEEWHARIPEYRLAAGAELIESGGQLGLDTLPLEW